MAIKIPKNETILIISAFLIGGVILAVDLMVPLGVAGGVPYIVLVLLGLWSKEKRFIIFSAIAGSFLTIFGFYYSPPGGELWKVIFNRFLALFAILVTATLCLVYKRSESKLKTTARQLIHSEKLSATGKLAASIAHEFNNPICGIRNTLERIIEKVSMEKSYQESTKIAINECNRITKLIDQINGFHRPSSSEIETFDIHKTIEEMVLLIDKKLKDRNIQLKKSFCQPVLMIRAIRDQIKQVILNLIQNAEESITKDSGEILISTLVLDSKLKIDIKDSGHGVSPSNSNKIFDPFFTTKSDVKGTGLGLSVSYGIIQNHGGSISVESKMDEGANFTLTLPLEGNI